MGRLRLKSIAAIIFLIILGSFFFGPESIANGVLPAPTLLEPASGARLSQVTTTLRWAMPQGATQYHLKVTPANNDGPGVNIIGNAVSEFTIPPPPQWYGLLPGMTYSWKLRSTDKATFTPEDDLTWGSWSEERTFRTPEIYSTGIAPVAPANGLEEQALPGFLYSGSIPTQQHSILKSRPVLIHSSTPIGLQPSLPFGGT